MPRHGRHDPDNAKLTTRKVVVVGVAFAAFVVGMWSTFQGHIAAQEECSDTFGEFVAAPERLAAFRSVAEDLSGEPEALQDVTLSWVNPGTHAECFTIEVQRVPASELGGSGSWEVLDKVTDPTQSRYLHLDVPTSAKVCYRVHASNRFGRSEYSNGVCLLELTSGTGEMEGAGAGDLVGMDMGSEGLQVWHVVVIALVAGVVLVTGGVAGWRYRAQRLKA